MARFGKNQGFTLLEILVAVAVLVVLVALLANVISFGQDSLLRIDSGARQRQEAIAVLEMVASELRASMAAPVQMDEYAQSGTRRAELLINPPLLGADLLNQGAIFWQSFSPRGRGAPSLVGYFLKWDTTQAGAPRPLLCRFQLESARAELELARLRGGTATRQWIDENVADDIAPGTADNGFQGWLADHVIGFFVRALDPTGNTISRQPPMVATNTMGRMQQFVGLNQPSHFYTTHTPAGASAFNDPKILAAVGVFDSLDGYSWDTGQLLDRATPTQFKQRHGPALPPMVELAIVVIPPRALRSLTAVPTYPAVSANFWTDIDAFVAGLPPDVAQSARVYSATVSLPPSPR